MSYAWITLLTPHSNRWASCLYSLVLAGMLTSGQTPHKPGVPAVQMPLAKLKPQAIMPVDGSPDWIGIDEAVWISNFPKNSVSRIDTATNQVAAVIPVGSKPCAGLANAFGSVWVPLCGDKKLVRIDPKTNHVSLALETPIGDSEGGIAAGNGSIWLMVDKLGTMVRIDPSSNKIKAKIVVPPESFTIASGAGAIWVTSSGKGLVTRVDPATNQVVSAIPVGKTPRFLSIGEGSVWTLNQGDGSVTRIDAKTNKVVATIQVGVPGEGGDISVGGGSVWVTSFQVPLSRIDVKTNKVVAQFAGGGGDAIRFGLGSVWLSNLEQHNVWRINPATIPIPGGH